MYNIHNESQDSPDGDLFDIGCLGGAIQGTTLCQMYSILKHTQDSPDGDLFEVSCLIGAMHAVSDMQHT